MTEPAAPALRQRFIDGMSHAACTVNVVTTDGPHGRAGVTVSAMSSVSADTPAPSLLVCVHQLSAAARAIIGNGVFCVNLLRDDQAYISDIFAGRARTADGDKFSCAGWTTQRTGAPRVVDPLVAFDCRLDHHVQIGTHHVFFGAVEDIFLARQGVALIYANRTYGSPSVLPADGAGPRPLGADRPVLRLGCFQTFGPYVVPSLLTELAQRLGPVDLRLVEGDQRRIVDGLLSGEAELALLYDFDLPDALVAEPLAAIAPYVLLPEGHRLAGRASIALAELIDEPMILLDAPPSRDYFLALAASSGRPPTIAYRSTSFEMVRGLVGHGLGYSLLATRPASSMSYDGQALVSRPLADPLPASRMVLARRKDTLPSPAAAAFAALCRADFASPPA
jgi:flavin reductase (DIM6/NTAB) family NADH-FMN oxidoreductase RutF